MSQFRPITLCNVVVKLVIKVIVNRLKPLMGQLAGACQSSFIPGCQSEDNLVIMQEDIHNMKSKKGKKGCVAIEVDLEKAYDRVNWDFLEKILWAASFGLTLTQLIMFCIRSTKLSL